jgi:D-sedoheptulose 7-phosphate isomerase
MAWFGARPHLTRVLRLKSSADAGPRGIIKPMLDLRIQQHFIDSADLQYQAAETLAKPLDAGVQALMACVTSGGKVLVCGEGSAAALAQYFASLFVGGFERERPELAAIALRHEGLGDPAYASLARQVRALGQAGDVLLLLTANGEEEGLMRALHAAHERDMTVIALTGKGGGAVAKALRETDVHVGIPHDRAARIREVQQLALHCLCDGVDAQLMGDQDTLSPD